MNTPYCCPNCKTNRTRFNMIKQVSRSVKMNPRTGEVIQEYTSENLDPFHIPYNGPEYKVQCGACGLVEDERMFIKFGEQKI
ncbi:DNA alkylation repair protein [Bacillus methanolicus]|uniref:DNA alkylation repair protein n=1 Tax=Bacillus methanolicus TaxID=1471 RepID=UPI00200F564F|nr:DNA alkylation repair protein [Bacillus methanolicus]UQD52426.1 DNA alkylation repair protein [Bacillus methanolicus]